MATAIAARVVLGQPNIITPLSLVVSENSREVESCELHESKRVCTLAGRQAGPHLKKAFVAVQRG